MRAWSPQEGESAKAFGCFSIYRDLGAERTLREAAAIHYGREDGPTRGEYDTVKRWSAAHDWQERTRPRLRLVAGLREARRRPGAPPQEGGRLRRPRGRPAGAVARAQGDGGPAGEGDDELPDHAPGEDRGGPRRRRDHLHLHAAAWNKATAIQMHKMMVGLLHRPRPRRPRPPLRLLRALRRGADVVIAAMDKVHDAPGSTARAAGTVILDWPRIPQACKMPSS